MGIEDVRCPECGLTVSPLEMGGRNMCVDCESENELRDRFSDERHVMSPPPDPWL